MGVKPVFLGKGWTQNKVLEMALRRLFGPERDEVRGGKNENCNFKTFSKFFTNDHNKENQIGAAHGTHEDMIKA